MIPTLEQREQIRLALLRYSAVPIRPGLLRANLRGEGYDLSRPQVEAELAYLADKGLLRAEAKLVSPENQVWRRTAAGTDYLAAQGEASE